MKMCSFLPAYLCLCITLFYSSLQAQQPQPTPVVPTGLQFVDDATYRSIPLASTPLMGALPQSIDMSAQFPQPGNQGQQASCVGWAVAYALKSYQEGVERHWSLNTPDQVFSPAYIYNQIKTSANCNGGTSYVEALNLLRREGVATWSTFPYDSTQCSRLPDAATKQQARQFAIADWRRVNVQDETEVKNQLAAGFPVLAGIVVDLPLYRLSQKNIYSQYSGQSVGGHAVVVVGYDDSKNAFKIINSWGQGWGDNGFGWISYVAFRQIAREGYVAQDIIVQPPPHQPGPQPQPVPTPSAPLISIGIPTIVHNVPVRHPVTGLIAPGMAITIPGTVSNAQGKTLQLVVRFTSPTGQALFANQAEGTYRDAQGLAATGTPAFPVQVPVAQLALAPVAIPYYALNLPPTGGKFNYTPYIIAFVYLDNYVVAQSQPVQFLVTY
jgi:hypothetical protein